MHEGAQFYRTNEQEMENKIDKDVYEKILC